MNTTAIVSFGASGFIALLVAILATWHNTRQEINRLAERVARIEGVLSVRLAPQDQAAAQ